MSASLEDPYLLQHDATMPGSTCIRYRGTVASDCTQSAPTAANNPGFIDRNVVVYRSHQVQVTATWDEDETGKTYDLVIEGRPKKPEPKLKPLKEPPPWALVGALRSPHRGLRAALPRDSRQQVWACRPRHGLGGG